MNTFLLVVGVIALLVLVRLGFRATNNKRNPKDHAFRIYLANPAKSNFQPMKKMLPSLTEGQYLTWVPDFKQTAATMDELASQGGPKRLGSKEVRTALKERHPFLGYEGLRFAEARIRYSALHNGFDRESSEK